MTVFGKNLFIKIILILVSAILVVVGLAVIKAIDSTRFQMEKISDELSVYRSKVDKLEQLLKAGQVPRNNSESVTAASQPLVNSRFFDKDAIRGGRIVIPDIADSKNMNILTNNDRFVSRIWEYVNCTLAARNYENPDIFEPLLAEKWNLSDDKLTFTVYLRKGVLWHDFKDPVSGKEWKDVEVTAEDFKFFADLVQNPDVDCAPLRVYYKDMERVEVIDRYTFKVHWKAKYFLSETSTLEMMPMPRHLYWDYQGAFNGKKFNDDFERNKIIVGCGPYRFDRWDSGQRIVLKRWDKYFGDRYGIGPALDSIVIEIIKHPNTQYQALMSGEVDMMQFTTEQWTNRTNTPEFDPSSPKFKIRKFQYPMRMYSYIGYNFRNPLFQDRRVRQALTCLVDREKLQKTVYSGLGQIVSGPYYIYSPYYDKDVKPYPFSIDRAEKLLNEAGWKKNSDGIMTRDGKPFEFTVLTASNSSSQEKMFPIIREDMRKAGILMNINKVEWSVLTQRVDKRNFDAVCLAWALSFDPDQYQLFHSSMADVESSSNLVGFRSKEADELIEQIRSCFDISRRIELCHKFHKLVHEEQPYTFLFSPDTLTGIGKDYHNVKLFRKYPIIPVDIMWLE